MSTEVQVLPRAGHLPTWGDLRARLPAALRGRLVGVHHGTRRRMLDTELVGADTVELLLGDEVVSAIWLNDTPATLDLNIEDVGEEWPLPPGVEAGWRALGHRVVVGVRPNGVWLPVTRALAELLDGVVLVDDGSGPLERGLYSRDDLFV
jgi:hypothetical protein